MTHEEARALSHSERTGMINRTCTQIDRNEKAGLPTRALWEKLEALSCAHGICDHYTCTEGAALAEWEAFEIRAGRL